VAASILNFAAILVPAIRWTAVFELNLATSCCNNMKEIKHHLKTAKFA
jgi:hypothetical protein